MAVRLMVLEINLMAGIQAGAVCLAMLPTRPGSQSAVCQSQTVRQLSRPGANPCSSASMGDFTSSITTDLFLLAGETQVKEQA